MPESADRLLLQFLDYIARSPRTYADVMDAWRSSCPRLSVWEDALAAGAVQITGPGPLPHRRITLTPLGDHLLNPSQNRAAPAPQSVP